MNKIRRWLLALLAVAAACAFWLSAPSVRADEAEAQSGQCGENLTWTFEDGTLTISGYGPMYEYGAYGPAVPWNHLKFSIKTVVIEAGITRMAPVSFDCQNLKEAYYTGTLEQWCGIEFLGMYANPLCDADYFYVNGELLSGQIRIPEGVTAISRAAFAGYSNMTGVVIPDSVTVIGNEVFYSCGSLTDVSIPDSVTVIGDHAFYDCISLEEVHLPDSVTTIGDHVFINCSSLQEVNIPDSVTSLGVYAFGYCQSLTQIHIPDSVTSIGACAFHSCTSLTGIVIPEGVTEISWETFNGCTSLTSVVIGKDVTDIWREAFVGCDSLTHVRFTGTKETWDGINIISGSECLTEAVIHYGEDHMDSCEYCKNPAAARPAEPDPTESTPTNQTPTDTAPAETAPRSPGDEADPENDRLWMDAGSVLRIIGSVLMVVGVLLPRKKKAAK